MTLLGALAQSVPIAAVVALYDNCAATTLFANRTNASRHEGSRRGCISVLPLRRYAGSFREQKIGRRRK
jgi:hypothetical protein